MNSTHSQNMNESLVKQEEGKINVLLVEDNPGDAKLLEILLQEIPNSPFVLEQADCIAQAVSKLNDGGIDVVLLDLSLPDSQGIETVYRLKEQYDSIPIIILTGMNNEEMALSALKNGVQDYLVKGQVSSEVISRSIRYAMERKKIEEQLKFHKSLLESESDASADGILIILSDDTIYSYNKRFVEMWQLEGKELKSMNGEMLFQLIAIKVKAGQDFLQVVKEICRESSTDEQSGEMSLKDGAYFDFHTGLIQKKDGSYYGRAWYFRDISDKKQIESMKDDFISTVSHELRTPLAIIKGTVGNLRDGVVGPLTPKQAKVVDTTNRNINRLARLINDLLDLSRLESGRVRAKRQQLSLTSILDDLIRDFTPEASEKGITLVKNTHNEVQDIYADHDMLVQLMSNLLNNALRYAKTNIEISVEPHIDDHLILSVTDDGQGVEQDNIDLLFNKFEQVNRPSGGSGYKGTGLGLAICKEIVSLHEGQIWVESEFGKGASFKVRLPYYTEQRVLQNILVSTLDHIEGQHHTLAVVGIDLTPYTHGEDLTNESRSEFVSCLMDTIKMRSLRVSDRVFQFQNDILIIAIPGIHRESAQKLVQRIVSVIHTSAADIGISIKNDGVLASDIVMYPTDEYQPDQILNRIIHLKDGTSN